MTADLLSTFLLADLTLEKVSGSRNAIFQKVEARGRSARAVSTSRREPNLHGVGGRNASLRN